MAQYIEKDKIEEILRNLWKQDDGHNPEHRICYNKALQEVQCEIDSLEVKEADLDKEKDDYWNKLCDSAFVELLEIDAKLFDDIAKHFFELGLKAQKGE